jgi:hypothetical protein
VVRRLFPVGLHPAWLGPSTAQRRRQAVAARGFWTREPPDLSADC